jgi:hypothetical protein
MMGHTNSEQQLAQLAKRGTELVEADHRCLIYSPYLNAASGVAKAGMSP